MSDLQQLQADSSITVPASAEKTFPDLYITDLVLRANYENLLDTRILVVLYPYNYATKEMHNAVACRQEFAIPDLWTEASRVPLLADVMGQLIALIGLMKQERSLQEQITNAEEGADTTTLQEQLVTVQSSLGIN